MRRLRPALAAAATLTLTAAAVPALGSPSSTTTPSTGSAQSSLTILTVAVGGHTVKLGTLAGVATNGATRVAQLVVTPAELDGTPYGQQTVTPAQAPATVDGSAKSVSIPNLLDATGPTFAVDAQAGPTAVLTSAVLKALGQLTLKPAGLVSIPVDLTATTLDDTAKVTSTQSQASKSLVVGNLALPSVNTLLGSLGVNVPALLDQLTQQALTTLGTLVGGSGLAALNTAVDTAQSKLTNAADTLAGAQAALAPAQTAVTTAQNTVATATAALTSANTAWSSALTQLQAVLNLLGLPTTLTPAQFQALSTAQQNQLAAVVPTITTLAANVVNDTASLATANTALSAAQAVLANVQALIDALQALVNAVAGAVTGNSNPIAALGNVTVTTKAVATDSSTPAPVAEASIGSLKILGADTAPAQLTSALNGVTTTLASVLDSVTGVKFTPPSIALGTGKTDTSTTGTTRKATASITGLTVSLGSIELPTQLASLTSAIPGAATITNGVASVLGTSLELGTLAEAASLTPGTSTSTPSTPSNPSSTPGSPSTPSSTPSTPSSPSLAKTGLATALPATAVLLILAGLAVLQRRRRALEG